MDFLTDIPSLQTAIMTFAMQSSLKLQTAAQPLFAAAASRVSPVDRIVATAECLYANQDNITDAPTKALAQTLCGQCAAFAAQYAWQGMDVRGPGIVSAMRRDLGEAAPAGQTWPDPSADPAPVAQWTPST